MNYRQKRGQQQVRIPPVIRKQPLTSMDFSIKNPGQKTRKWLMPLVFSQWHLNRLDFVVAGEGFEPTTDRL